MQKTKRCHWVAQAYLRAFAADQDQRKIWRLSKEAGDPQLKPIEKVAVKFHLYAPLKANGTRDDSLERKLGNLERFFGDPIWHTVCNGFPDYGWEPLRKMVALLASVSYLRTPLNFEKWNTFHHQMVGFIAAGERLPDYFIVNDAKVPVDHDSWSSFRDANQEDLKANWHDHISEAGWLAELLLKLRWTVIFCDQPVFITSDNPVMVAHPSMKFRGFKDPESIVIFPLSPTRVLLLDHRHSEPDARYYPLAHHPGITNGLIWRNAIDHMFSPRHPDIICAEIDAGAREIGF